MDIGQPGKSVRFEVALTVPTNRGDPTEYTKGYMAWEGLVEPVVSVTNRPPDLRRITK